MVAKLHIRELSFGSGGLRPGVDLMAFDGRVRVAEAFLPLPASVYAMDLDPCRALLACGTRGGTIHLVQFSEHTEAQPLSEVARLLHGRPVLAVCFAADRNLISVDDSGQVLCWHEGERSSAERWVSGGPVICALTAPVETLAVGLGVDGQVFFWDASSGRLLTTLFGPPPVRPLALVRLNNWMLGQQVMLAYPASGGQLAVIGVDPPLVRVQSAHEGRWYASLPIQDGLVTIGYDDATARFWRWSADALMCDEQRSAFPGVVSAAGIWGTDPHTGVAILRDGRAVTFALTGDSLQVEATIPGDAYRAVVVPCERLCRRHDLHQTQQRANELHESIATSIESHDDAGIDDALAELDQLGFHAASLCLQVQHAHRLGNELAELQALHQLVVDRDRSGLSVPAAFLERYMDLLLQFGQMELAAEVADRIKQVSPDVCETLDTDGLREAARAIQAGETVVHATRGGSQQLGRAIEAARILGRPIQGAWELHQSDVLLLPGVTLNPEQLAIAIRAGNDNRPEPMVCATAQSAMWIHGRVAKRVAITLLQDIHGCPGAAVKIALQLARRSAGMELRQSILLDTHPGDPKQTSELRVERLLSLVTQLEDEASRRALLTPVNKRVFTTLRQICSAAVASELDRVGAVA